MPSARKASTILQARKVTVRLVQMAACLVEGATVAAGARTLTLSFLPPAIGPGQQWMLGNILAPATLEMVRIESVNANANMVTLEAATKNAHVPYSAGVYTSLMPARTVPGMAFGRPYFASAAGLNSREGRGGGWSSGTYMRTLEVEGTFGLDFPNSSGPDGIAHRDRFLLSALGQYRPGDEWLEIYAQSSAGGAGDLLAVGTPLEMDLTGTELKLAGADGMWLLKKQRESHAGFWCNSPRDVFEEYTKRLGVYQVNSFSDPTALPATPVSAPYTTPDGEWKIQNGAASPTPGCLRLFPYGTARIIGTRRLGIGGTVAELSQRWRLETSFTTPPGSRCKIAFGLVNEVEEPRHTMEVEFGGGPESPCRATVQEPGNIDLVNLPLPRPLSGAHTMAVECRGRWVFFYLDGVLKAVIQNWRKELGTNYVSPYLEYQNGTEASPLTPPNGEFVDVDYILLRRAEPMLMQSATDKGDYRLPGVPTGNGLKGEYFNDTDLASLYLAQMGRHNLSPVRSSAAQRVDSSIAFTSSIYPSQTRWTPEGLPAQENMSVRWTGSVYLDLSNHDYKFRMHAHGGCRIWVGKTQWGEQLLESWPLASAGKTDVVNAESSLVAGSKATPGPLFKQQSGWYPIIIEFECGPSSLITGLATQPAIIVSVARADTPSMWVPLNVGPWGRAVAEDVPYAYFPLDTIVGIEASEATFNSLGTSTDYFNVALPGNIAGPVPNGRALYMQQTISPQVSKLVANTTAMFTTNGFSGTGISYELWIKPETGPYAAEKLEEVILEKDKVFRLGLIAAGNLRVLFSNGVTYGLELTAGTPPFGQWSHVAVTYDGSNARIYLNGTLVGTSAAVAGQYSNSTADYLYTGLESSAAGLKTGTQFQGGIAHLAFYKAVQSSAQINARITRGLGTVLLNGGTVEAVSEVPTSPQGIFEQQVQIASYYEQLREFAENWGFQWTCKPMAFESGEFPGRMCPRIQEGRQTNLTLDAGDLVGPASKIKADETADTLTVDASGLAAPGSSGQLQAEVFNFDELGAHGLVSSETDTSAGGIQVLQQLLLRATSLLNLRGAPWQEFQSAVPGRNTLTDTVPLTGEPAEFAWLPGDGVEIYAPKLAVEDSSPRQMYSVAWPVFPDGIGAPTPSFRARTRSPREVLRKIQQAITSKHRTYQGQFAVVPGSIGAQNYNNGALTPRSAGSDQYTRITLPPLSQVMSLTLCVQLLEVVTPPVTYTLQVNESVSVKISGPGRYPITNLLANDIGQGTNRMYAKLIGAGTGQGNYEISLEAQVMI